MSAHYQHGKPQTWPEYEVFARPSVIIAAHPDDEIIGLGAHLSRLEGPIIHVTDGAPRNLRDARAAGFDSKTAYAAARRLESGAAMRLAGVLSQNQLQLGITDQEATLCLERLTLTLADLLANRKPELVFTHPYEGGHPDHDATSFAVQSAIKLLAKSTPATPTVFEFTSYHAGPEGMSTDFLPNSAAPVQVFHLCEEQMKLKQKMFDCFPTQQHVLRNFPVETEQVRRAPSYDFSQPPHPGHLFYENFDWGMTGERWRRLAAEARLALGI